MNPVSNSERTASFPATDLSSLNPVGKRALTSILASLMSSTSPQSAEEKGQLFQRIMLKAANDSCDEVFLTSLKSANSPQKQRYIGARYEQYMKDKDTQIRLGAKLAGRSIEKLFEESNRQMEAAIPGIELALSEADKKGCLPCQVVIDREKIQEELIRDEESNNKAEAAKRKAPKGRLVKQPLKKKETEEKVAIEKAVQKETSDQHKARILSQIVACRSKYGLHPRVTKRWRVSDPGVIRGFTDKDSSGGDVCRYAKLSADAIDWQRSCHFLPGLEKILSIDRLVKSHSFKTTTGFGMLAQLVYHNQPHNGIVYFGIGKDGVIIHRYFEEKEEISSGAASCFTDSQMTHIHDEEKAEGWINTADFSVELESKGILKFLFSNEVHYIKIYPCRKEFLTI